MHARAWLTDPPAQVLERGMGYLYPEALEDDRIGGGHPEGLIEAWSNLYYRFAMAMEAIKRGDTESVKQLNIPDIYAGFEGFAGLRTAYARPITDLPGSITDKYHP